MKTGFNMDILSDKDLLKLLWVFYELCEDNDYYNSRFSLLKYLKDYNLLNQENIKTIVDKISDKDFYIV